MTNFITASLTKYVICTNGGVWFIVDESCLGADQSSSSVVMSVLLMTLSTVVLEFMMELMDWFVLLDLVIQAHISFGITKLLSSLFQDSLILCTYTINAYISEFLEPTLDYFWVFT